MLSEMELQDGVVVQQFVLSLHRRNVEVQTRSFLSVWIFYSPCGSEFSPSALFSSHSPKSMQSASFFFFFFLNGL